MSTVDGAGNVIVLPRRGRFRGGVDAGGWLCCATCGTLQANESADVTIEAGVFARDGRALPRLTGSAQLACDIDARHGQDTRSVLDNSEGPALLAERCRERSGDGAKGR